MKKRKILAIILATLTLALIFAGCASSTKSAQDSSYNYATDEGAYLNDEGIGMSGKKLNNASNDVATDAGGEPSKVEVKKEQRKLIKTVDVYAETKEFDSFINTVEKLIKDYDGYIESSEISGNNYYNSYSNRNAEYTIRIPADKLDEFTNKVSKDCNVTSKRENVSDVTMQYVDTESRLASLKAEKESLLKILKEAEEVTDIIDIQDRLTDVVYEIESYQSQLRTYDNLVDYSTVNLDITEVSRETTTTPKKATVWQRIKDKLSDNFYDIGEWFKDLFVFFVGNIPYFIIWAIVIVAIVLIIKGIIRSNRKKRAKRLAQKEKEEKEKEEKSENK
jgi:hypothetical protein